MCVFVCWFGLIVGWCVRGGRVLLVLVLVGVWWGGSLLDRLNNTQIQNTQITAAEADEGGVRAHFCGVEVGGEGEGGVMCFVYQIV